MSTTRTIPVRSRSASITATAGSDRGRGRGRGGERGRGRGGHRGGHRGGPSRQQDERNVAERPGIPLGTREQTQKPRLTHFLAMPLGHHAELRGRLSAFTDNLLASTPAIPGLDPSIVIAPRRLHITLGVMSLTEDTLMHALALLRRLKPHVMGLLAGEPLRVGLHSVDIMRPDRGDPTQAHVMWVGPPREGEDAERLKRVAEFVNREFREAGLVIDEKRPLKLHCTVLNTTYRRPRPQGARIPFSYAAVLSSAALQAIERPDTTVATRQRGRGPISVDFGEWSIDEIQVCEMGSWGPEGEYVSVGHITLD